MSPATLSLGAVVLSAFLLGGAAALKQSTGSEHTHVPEDDSNDACGDKVGVELSKDTPVSKDQLEWMKRDDEWFALQDKLQAKQGAFAQHRRSDDYVDIDMTSHWNKTLFFFRAAEHHCEPDGRLNDNGHAQCDRIMDRWENSLKMVERVVTSPYNRAIQTALHLFPQEKIHFSQYVMEHRGVIIKGQGRETLLAANATRMLDDYLELWEKHDEMIGEWSAPNFKHDPDRIMTEYATPGDRWEHFVMKLKREKAKHIAVITHRRFVAHMLGGHTGNDFHRDQMKVGGIIWLPDGGYKLQQVDSDIWYSTRERVASPF